MYGLSGLFNPRLLVVHQIVSELTPGPQVWYCIPILVSLLVAKSGAASGGTRRHVVFDVERVAVPLWPQLSQHEASCLAVSRSAEIRTSLSSCRCSLAPGEPEAGGRAGLGGRGFADGVGLIFLMLSKGIRGQVTPSGEVLCQDVGLGRVCVQRSRSIHSRCALLTYAGPSSSGVVSARKVIMGCRVFPVTQGKISQVPPAVAIPAVLVANGS